jgi:DNA-binding transcriptional LysR family regulator
VNSIKSHNTNDNTSLIELGPLISFELLTSFVCAARHRSFARAARELGTSPSAVAKNVARLESQLKLRLFHRTTRRVALTPDGELLQERCQRVLEEVAELEGAVAGKLGQPSGTLKLDVPIVYGRRVVLPVLAKLRHHYPDLSFDVRFSDRVADVVGDGLDAVIRVGTLNDSSLVARRIGWQRMWTGASPAYLRRHGTPLRPANLEQHQCLVFRIPTSRKEWSWRFRVGSRDVVLRPPTQVWFDDGEALVAAALAGLGLVHVPSYMAEEDVARGRLVEVLSDVRPPLMPISIVYPGPREPPLRVRVLIEALTAAADT